MRPLDVVRDFWWSTLTCLSPRAIPESLSDVIFDYHQRTSAEDLVPVLQA
jgi:hypothetical protein